MSNRSKMPSGLKKPILVEVEPPSTCLVDLIAALAKDETSREHAIKLLQIDAGEGQRQVEETIIRERVIKLLRLCEWYGIKKNDPDQWFILAFQLACDFVPGFRIQAKGRAGRPKEWDFVALARLYFDVQELEGQGFNEHAACRELTKKRSVVEQERRDRWKGTPAKTLYNRYLESRTSPMALYFQQADEKILASVPGIIGSAIKSGRLRDDFTRLIRRLDEERCPNGEPSALAHALKTLMERFP